MIQALAELQFTRPQWLWALLALPLLAAWWLRRSRRGDGWARRVDPHLLPHLLAPGSRRRGVGRVLLAAVACVLAILALAGPGWRQQEHALWQQKSEPAAFLAKRFAAKEAFVKALGLGLRQGLQWCDIQVLNDALGKPYFLLNGEAGRLLQAAGVTTSHVTLSDEAEYAVAFVVLEREL